MVQDKNVGFAILKAAVERPDLIALRNEHISLTYETLANMAISFALNLSARGLRQGQTLAVRSDDIVIVLASLIASALLGLRWVYGTRATLGSGRILVDLFAHTDPADAGLARNATLVDEAWAAPPPSFDRNKPPQFPGYRTPEDIWMIAPTSGTTGTPKLVGLGYRTMSDRLSETGGVFTGPGMGFVGLFTISAFPLQTRLLAALLHKATIVWSLDPDFWVKSDVGFIFGSPAQALKSLEGKVLSRKLPIIQLGGGQISDAMARDLLQSFDEVRNNYGSTETNNLLGNHKTLADDGSIANETVVNPGVEVQTVDENQQPVPVGTEGIVRARNAYLAPGYIDSPEAEAAAFRDGWFYPGDLAIWTREGEFVVTGRQNEQFNLGGTKLNAQLIDFTMMNVAGVRDAISFLMPQDGRPDRLTAFLSVDPGADTTEVLSTAKVELMRLGGMAAVPERFLFADMLPRNANGKADRKACVALVLEARARQTATS